MASKKQKPAVSEEFEKQARSLIQHAFSFFRKNFGRLSGELDKVDAEHAATKERINRGARRTSGRIV